MSKIPLRLNQSSDDQDTQSQTSVQQVSSPLSGWLAVGFGLVGIFGPGFIFTPLGLIFSIIALLRGQGGWGFAGLLLAVGGFLSSPTLMALVGLGAAAAFIDWDAILKPVYEMLGGGVDI